MESGNLLSEGTRVRVTIPTIDFPEYTETQTVVKRGRWEVRVKGYTEIIPGEVVEVEGIWDGKRIIGDTVTQCHEEQCSEVGLIDKVLIGVSYVRRWAVAKLQTQLPEPMASLAAGILLGIKARMPRDFYEALVMTGTLHIVAASGFNVMIVATLLINMFGKIWKRSVAIAMGVGGIIFYVLIAGGSASVVRAGIMGSLTLIAYYWGRPTEAKWLLWVTAFVMVMVDPMMLTDVGFQLSVAATGGLLYFEPVLDHKSSELLKSSELKKQTCLPARQGYEPCWGRRFAKEYLLPTLVATACTAPVIWWHFGRLSWIGVGVNLLILPLIPLIMLLSALALVVPGVGYLLYVPLWWVVGVIRMFG